MTPRPVAWAACLAAGLLLLPACAREEAPPAPLEPPALEAVARPVDPPEEPPAAAPEADRRPSLTARDEPPAAGAGSPPPDAPPAQLRPLEDLLRLPDGAGRGESASTPLELPKPETGAEEKTGKPAERRIQVELGTRKDASVIDPERARTRTDAGVAVEVGKDTKLRTGVRVEQETGLEREQPHPTVGIEKRF